MSLASLYVGWLFREIVYDIEWTKVFKERDEVIAKESAIEEKIRQSSRKLRYQEVSPDRKHVVRMYEMPFHPGLNDHYYDYLSSQFFLAVGDEDSKREQYIFVADYKSGNPHWLDNGYVYFTAGCGTACQGLYLVNTGNKASKLGVLSYIFSDDRGIWKTYFKDWFHQEFTFDGLVDDIKAELLDGNAYLIFAMKDDKKNSLGHKRFLFSGESLTEMHDQ
ncbi:hypothetical protein HY008_03645 [Candidatus Woesebacteria bacterium]|nr:hypothetical protein [Candidatus Woesebacteria bacterium]